MKGKHSFKLLSLALAFCMIFALLPRSFKAEGLSDANETVELNQEESATPTPQQSEQKESPSPTQGELQETTPTPSEPATSPELSETPAVTPTPSDAVTPSPEQTATPAPTPSNAATPSPEQTATPAPTPSNAVTPTPEQTAAPSPTLSARPSPEQTEQVMPMMMAAAASSSLSNQTYTVNGVTPAQITIRSADASMGLIDPGAAVDGDFNSGETWTFTAVPEDGYEFVNWTYSGSNYVTLNSSSTDETLSFRYKTSGQRLGNDPSKKFTATANFQPAPTYTVTYNANGG